MVKKRVVITGVGTVNPLGNNYDEFIKNLFEGKNAISVDDSLESSGIETNLLALVKDFKLRKHLPNKKMRKLLNNGEETGISFRGIPNGHEFTSLLLAVLNADGSLTYFNGSEIKSLIIPYGAWNKVLIKGKG